MDKAIITQVDEESKESTPIGDSNVDGRSTIEIRRFGGGIYKGW